MKKIIGVFLSLFAFFHIQAQLTLSTDYTNSDNAKTVIDDHLDVYNRISPTNGFRSPSPANAKLCIVRPLGGNSSNGNPNLSKDTYLWNESSKKFYTDFTLLKKQIDGVYNKGFGIHQIVLDNPSWAFQRNADGSLPGGSYVKSTYGNAKPPVDYNAWSNYLKDVMNFLVATYGKEKVLSIQYGIGREIGTAGHWTGTKEQFFQFYKQSVEAIHEVLPEAKVGSHFLWGSSNHPWGTDFVKYCKTNDVHYDQIGVSFYPFYHQSSRTNFTEVYKKDFGAIRDIPEWNENAKMEIHEYALIKSMGGAGNSYESAEQKYQVSFLVGLMKMFYENDIENLFSWGTGSQYSPAYKEILAMKGDTYYTSLKSGIQNLSSNYVNAIFSGDETENKYSIMAYNYNANVTSDVSEDLILSATIRVPTGTEFEYRSAVYNNLNGTFTWSTWQDGVTTGNSLHTSKVSFNAQLPVFSFLKYEIRIIGTIPPPNYIYSCDENQTVQVTGIMDVAYGAKGKYTYLYNQTSNVTCTAETFGDPSSGGVNKCFVRFQYPDISFNKPLSDTIINANYTNLHIAANAFDGIGTIDFVTLSINDSLIVLKDSIFPYEWGNPDSTNANELLGLYCGIHKVKVTATDNDGLSKSDSVYLTVTGQECAPDVYFVSPKEDTAIFIKDSIILNVAAFDSNTYIQYVDLFSNNKLVRRISEPPYTWGGSKYPDDFKFDLGSYTLKVVAINQLGLSAVDSLQLNVNPIDHAIPGKIEAEYYSEMSGVSKQKTEDIGGGENVGLINFGDWMKYMVTIDSSTNYVVEYRVASRAEKISFILLLGNTNTVDNINESKTGALQTWKTISHNIKLESGEHILEVYAFGDGWNLNYLNFKYGSIPAVKINVPAADTVIHDDKMLYVHAIPNDADSNIVKLSLFIDDSLIRDDFVAPFEWGKGTEFPAELVGFNEGKHTLKVIVVDGHGYQSEASREFTFSNAIVDNIQKNTTLDFNIYPNPTNDVLHVEFFNSLNESANVTISNLLGETVLRKTLECCKATLNVSDLNSGVYFLQAKTKMQTTTKQFIKK